MKNFWAKRNTVKKDFTYRPSSLSHLVSRLYLLTTTVDPTPILEEHWTEFPCTTKFDNLKLPFIHVFLGVSYGSNLNKRPSYQTLSNTLELFENTPISSTLGLLSKAVWIKQVAQCTNLMVWNLTGKQ